MEAIFEGNWASGPWPEEMTIVDTLMETGWSWEQWCATPPYLQRVTVDYIHARRNAQQAADERRQQQHEAVSRHGH
jgi:hypothetical protein